MGLLYLIMAIAVGAAGAGALYYFFVLERGNVFYRAFALARAGNYVDARAILRSKVELESDNPRGHYYMSRIYSMEGNEEQELEHLLKVKRIGRYMGEVNATQVLSRLAQLYYEQDRLGDSFENYLEVLQYDPGNEVALAYVAFMAVGQGEFEVADRFFRRLVKAAPNNADYQIARGVTQAMLKSKEARESLKMGVDLAPGNQTAQFLYALHSFREGDANSALSVLGTLLPQLTDTYVSFIGSKLATAVYYLTGEYEKALEHAENCLNAAMKENWEEEEYDARMSVAYMAMLNGDLEKANEHLLELEIRNPADETVMKVSDFRMDLEEQVAQIDQVSPRGFDFRAHMQDWIRNRFPSDALYRLSGLQQDVEFDLLRYFTKDGSVRKVEPAKEGVDPMAMIEKFNSLKGELFLSACTRIITSLGYRIKKTLPYRDKDGADFLSSSAEDKKITALFRIRQWKNQPISDIFLREQQNYMNEHKANLGFVVAGAKLTSGAEAALKNLKKITVINEEDLGELLQKIL